MTRPAIIYLPGQHCLVCKQRFSDLNVFTEAGLAEIHISGVCEVCFDELTAEEE